MLPVTTIVPISTRLDSRQSDPLTTFLTIQLSNPLWEGWPIADIQQAQLLMVAGFVMLGWVLARRQIRMRKRVNRDARAANKALQQIRDHKEPAVPLSDAPAETQRWQVALFDLQRELKAELDTRIVVVQTLLKQVDQRIERLAKLEQSVGACNADSSFPSTVTSAPTAVTGEDQQNIVRTASQWAFRRRDRRSNGTAAG